MAEIYMILLSQQTAHISPSRTSYGVYLVRISEKIDSVITAPHCNMVDNICGKGYLTSRNAYICIRDFYEMQIPYTISLFNTNDSWRYIKDSLHRTVAIHLITTVQRAIPDGHGDGLSHRTTHAERTSGHLMLRTYILWFIYQVWRLPFMDFSSTKQLYAWFSPFIYPPVCLSNLKSSFNSQMIIKVIPQISRSHG